MNTAVHTPTPWHIVRDHPNPTTRDHYIEIKPVSGGAHGEHSSLEIACLYCAEAGGIQEANGKFIVRAVNSHDANLKRIAELEEALRSMLTDVQKIFEHSNANLAGAAGETNIASIAHAAGSRARAILTAKETP